MNKTTLYAIDKNGGIKEWTTWTDGETLIVQHGKLGGKMQLKKTVSKPKNVGKKNETTAEEQALKDMQSKINKQQDKGYRPTIDEAKEAEESQRLPMLAADFTKVGHLIQFPCYVSPKLDGVRCIARVEEGVVTFTSRGGKEYPVPEHIRKNVVELSERTGIKCFDGELYIHGVSLQNIVSAVKKPNELTPKLQFWIFDVPSEARFKQRDFDLERLHDIVRRCITKPAIKVVLNETATNKTHAREFMNSWLEEGFEGMMLRNVNGVYEWNHRSSDLQKWKDFQDLEAKVVGFEEDNLGEAVYHMRLSNGLICKAKPRGNHTYRSVNNVKMFLNNWVTLKFQAYTDDGNCQFPVIVGLRVCDETGTPLE